jgi:hypothetical protein
MKGDSRPFCAAISCLLATALLCVASPVAHAAVIYKSASLGPIGQSGGHEVNASLYFASRFTVTQDTQVTRIGGHMRCNTGCGERGAIFGAIVKISPETGFPPFNPSEIGQPSKVLAYTRLTPTQLSKDVRAILRVLLPPGEYALVFGSGALGASGSASLPDNNPVLPGASFFQGTVGTDTWTNIDTLPMRWRFVVDGEPLPWWQLFLRKTTLVSVGIGILLAVVFVWALRRRRQRGKAES